MVNIAPGLRSGQALIDEVGLSRNLDRAMENGVGEVAQLRVLQHVSIIGREHGVLARQTESLQPWDRCLSLFPLGQQVDLEPAESVKHNALAGEVAHAILDEASHRRS